MSGSTTTTAYAADNQHQTWSAPQQSLQAQLSKPNKSLTRNTIRRLRDDLINTVSQLYDAHVAYVLDLATFSVVKKLSTCGKEAVFVPFLDTFDFDKRPDNPTTSWEDLKNEQVAIVKAHFDVLEVTSIAPTTLLAELSESSTLSHPPTIRVDLQPDIAVKVVKQSRPHDNQFNWVIRSMNMYSPELGQLVVEHARWRARTLPPRTDLADMSTNNSIRDDCSTISHVLGLLDQYMRNRRAEYGDLVDRAALLVVHAVLLIHLHAKAIAAVHSRGILEMNSDGTADAYTSYDNFQAVAKARSLAKEAICRLETNDQLDAGITCFLRADTENGVFTKIVVPRTKYPAA
ncbi:hypothetical protein DL766_008587 [Monosporascus sp. MC13-8B]|nr:hypothetical protein DL766_008587 [Monosporascus sp. MC13-8B]